MRFVIVMLCLLLGGIAIEAQPVAAASQQALPETKAAAATALNLNSATVEQLQKLPGIGPKTAARILDYRQKNGGFKKIEELMNVRGIGEKTFLRMKAQLTVGTAKPNPQ